MTKVLSCIDVDQKVKKTIDKLIKKYLRNHNRWANERDVHYELFRLLFNEFLPEEIKKHFRWEYSVGVPSYAKGNRGAFVDIGIYSDDGKWVAIELEYEVAPGKNLRDELKKCILKLKSCSVCQNTMYKGYVIPLLKRKGQNIAPRHGISYRDLCKKIFDETESEIQDFPIELIREGVILE